MKRILPALAGVALLGMGWLFPNPPIQRVVVQPSAFCAAPYEMEIGTVARPQVVARGLRVGDCVELDLGLKPRLCCPVSPRRCGARAVSIAPQTCRRVITP